LIWPYNFAVLGIASYQVSRSLTRFENITWLVFFGLSIAAALTWAYQFYVPHNFLYASLALTSAALLTLPVLLLAFRASMAMGLLLVPYQIWVAIAASLAWGYLAKN
jgi:tryptophan-rich sensory protein